MLFIANTIATIISCCSHKEELQQQHHPQLLISVVCVVIVPICIVISLNKSNSSTRHSQKHQQQEGKLYKLIENEQSMTTSNHVSRVRLPSNVCNLYYRESQQQTDLLVEFIKASTHVIGPSFTPNILERLDKISVFLKTLSNNRRCVIYFVGKAVISIYTFYTFLFLDIPKYDQYYYLIFILPTILRYLLFSVFTNFVLVSNKQTVTCRIINFVPSRIHESKFEFLL